MGRERWDDRRRRRQKPRFRSGHLRSLSLPSLSPPSPPLPSLVKLNLRANDKSPLQIHPLQKDLAAAAAAAADGECLLLPSRSNFKATLPVRGGGRRPGQKMRPYRP